MTLVVELDDGTRVDVMSTVRETVTAYAENSRIVLHLTKGDAELLIGFRGDRGMCYWRQHPSDDLVSCGGDNTETEVYGANQIAVPPGAEIAKATVIEAAAEFATTGTRPTCITWTHYSEAMHALPMEETITPEQLRALLDEPDTGR